MAVYPSLSFPKITSLAYDCPREGLLTDICLASVRLDFAAGLGQPTLRRMRKILTAWLLDNRFFYANLSSTSDTRFSISIYSVGGSRTRDLFWQYQAHIVFLLCCSEICNAKVTKARPGSSSEVRYVARIRTRTQTHNMTGQRRERLERRCAMLCMGLIVFSHLDDGSRDEAFGGTYSCPKSSFQSC